MSTLIQKVLLLNPRDNVVIALDALTLGESVSIQDAQIQVVEPIPQGHKMARHIIGAGQPIIKYGDEIGLSKVPIEVGQHVHVHNVFDNTAEVSLRERRRLGL